MYRSLTLCETITHIPKWVPSAFGTSLRQEGAGKTHHFPVNTFLLACADPYIPELEGTGRCRVGFLSERFSSWPWTLIYSPSRLMGDGGYFLHSPLGNHALANGVEKCWENASKWHCSMKNNMTDMSTVIFKRITLTLCDLVIRSRLMSKLCQSLRSGSQPACVLPACAWTALRRSCGTGEELRNSHTSATGEDKPLSGKCST